MGQYLVQITLPEYLDEEFLALIPEQRAYADTLMGQGIIASYSLAMDRSTLWVVFNSTNEKNVVSAIDNFPIADYIDYEVVELAFHNSSSVVFPNLSLN